MAEVLVFLHDLYGRQDARQSFANEVMVPVHVLAEAAEFLDFRSVCLNVHKRYCIDSLLNRHESSQTTLLEVNVTVVVKQGCLSPSPTVGWPDESFKLQEVIAEGMSIVRCSSMLVIEGVGLSFGFASFEWNSARRS